MTKLILTASLILVLSSLSVLSNFKIKDYVSFNFPKHALAISRNDCENGWEFIGAKWDDSGESDNAGDDSQWVENGCGNDEENGDDDDDGGDTDIPKLQCTDWNYEYPECQNDGYVYEVYTRFCGDEKKWDPRPTGKRCEEEEGGDAISCKYDLPGTSCNEAKQLCPVLRVTEGEDCPGEIPNGQCEFIEGECGYNPSVQCGYASLEGACEKNVTGNKDSTRFCPRIDQEFCDGSPKGEPYVDTGLCYESEQCGYSPPESCENKTSWVENPENPEEGCAAVVDCQGSPVSIDYNDCGPRPGFFGQALKTVCHETGEIKNDVIGGENADSLCDAKVDSCGNEIIIEETCRLIVQEPIFARVLPLCQDFTCDVGKHCEVSTQSGGPICVDDPVPQEETTTEEECKDRQPETPQCGPDAVEKQYGFVWNNDQCIRTLLDEKTCTPAAGSKEDLVCQQEKPSSYYCDGSVCIEKSSGWDGAACVDVFKTASVNDLDKCPDRCMGENTQSGQLVKLLNCINSTDPTEREKCDEENKRIIQSGQKVDQSSLYKASLVLKNCSALIKEAQEECEEGNRQTRELGRVLDSTTLEDCSQFEQETEKTVCRQRNSRTIKLAQHQLQLGIKDCARITDETLRTNCEFENYRKNKMAEAAANFEPEDCSKFEHADQRQGCEDGNKQKYLDAVLGSSPFVGKTELGASCVYTESCPEGAKKACVGKVEKGRGGEPVCRYDAEAANCSACIKETIELGRKDNECSEEGVCLNGPGLVCLSDKQCQEEILLTKQKLKPYAGQQCPKQRQTVDSKVQVCYGTVSEEGECVISEDSECSEAIAEDQFDPENNDQAYCEAGKCINGPGKACKVDSHCYFSSVFESGQECRQAQPCTDSEGQEGEQVCKGVGDGKKCDLSQGGGECSSCQPKATIRLNKKAECNEAGQCIGAPAIEGCMDNDECPKPVLKLAQNEVVGGDGQIYQAIHECRNIVYNVVAANQNYNNCVAESARALAAGDLPDCDKYASGEAVSQKGYTECTIRYLATGKVAAASTPEEQAKVKQYLSDQLPADKKNLPYTSQLTAFANTESGKVTEGYVQARVDYANLASSATNVTHRYLDSEAKNDQGGAAAYQALAANQNARLLEAQRRVDEYDQKADIDPFEDAPSVEVRLADYQPTFRPVTDIAGKNISLVDKEGPFFQEEVGKRKEIAEQTRVAERALTDAQDLRLQYARSGDYAVGQDPLASTAKIEEDPLYKQKLQEAQTAINKLKGLGAEAAPAWQDALDYLGERTDVARSQERLIEQGNQMASLLSGHGYLGAQSPADESSIAFLQSAGRTYANRLVGEGLADEADQLETRIGESSYLAWLGQYQKQFQSGASLDPRENTAIRDIVAGLNLSADQVGISDADRAEAMRNLAAQAPAAFAQDPQVRSDRESALGDSDQEPPISNVIADFPIQTDIQPETQGDPEVASASDNQGIIANLWAGALNLFAPVGEEVFVPVETEAKKLDLAKAGIGTLIEQQRQAREISDPGYANRVDKDLNKDRVNFLVFGYGEEHGEAYNDFGGSISIVSYDLKTGKIGTISLSRDIRAPELERMLIDPNSGEKRSLGPATLREVYKRGGFEGMREIAEKATGLSIDHQMVMKDTAIRDYLAQVSGPVDVDINKPHLSGPFRIGGKEFPGGVEFQPGKQRLSPELAIRYLLAEDINPQGKVDERAYRKTPVMEGMVESTKTNLGADYNRIISSVRSADIGALSSAVSESTPVKLWNYASGQRENGSIVLSFNPTDQVTGALLNAGSVATERALEGLNLTDPRFLLGVINPTTRIPLIANRVLRLGNNINTLTAVTPDRSGKTEVIVHAPGFGDSGPQGGVQRLHQIWNGDLLFPGQPAASQKVQNEAAYQRAVKDKGGSDIGYLLIPFGGNPYSNNLVNDYWKSVRCMTQANLTGKVCQ